MGMTTLAVSLAGRDVLRSADLAPAETEAVLDLASELKLDRYEARLPGRTLGLLFKKPSTRTRVSFAVAIAQLGGAAVELRAQELQLSRGESLEDTARVLSSYLDAIAIRTFWQHELDEWAAASSIPIVNALTDDEHPCQALADVLTIRERVGGVDGVRVAYVGDGNNVCASLLVVCSALGADVVCATPAGYEPKPAELAAACAFGGKVSLTHDPVEAVAGAQVVYTDVWTSMGEEAERERRLHDFAGFGVDAALLSGAASDAIVLHCLPAHTGEEISAEVLYGPQSAVWQQAENRLHVQKALLALLLD
jgi:ornithine carbamoyltransferase